MTVLAFELFIEGLRDWCFSLTLIGWKLEVDCQSGCRRLIDVSLCREART
ncbi:hypothetical protein [Brevundimonas sp.]|nr:hypothetical protein [Brevundimonas sp.]